jgi:hypothetical protein
MPLDASHFNFFAEGSIPPQGIFWVHFSVDISFIAHILIHSNTDVRDARQILRLYPPNLSKKSELPRKTTI